MSACGMVVMATLAPIWGTLADRHGRKAMVVRALFGGDHGGPDGPGPLPLAALALRTVQGLLGDGLRHADLVASVAPAAELGFTLGVMQTAAFIGTSIGPLLGGLIADRYGYPVAFGFTGVLLVCAGIAVLLLVHEDFRPPAPQPAGAPTPGCGAPCA